MSDTVDIGAARVRLIVDSADFEPIIEQGKRAVRGFGNEAQQAYDKTEKGSRRAADALLDYVASLGRADTTMDRYIRNASRMGVEKPILDAAISAWQKHNDEVELAATLQADNDAAIRKSQAAYKELLTTQAAEEDQLKRLANAQAQVRIEAQQAQHAANAQQDFNSLTAPGLSAAGNGADRRSAATSAFGPLLDAQDAKAAQDAANAYADFNKQIGLGIPDQQKALTLTQARANAIEAFTPMIKAEIDAEKQADDLKSSQAAFVKQLQNTEQAAGKTYYELLHLKAAELGVSEAADPLINKLKLTNQQLGAGTISAKQYEFAIRGLPAQFTDVFVSLAAGQNPLTVLLQQGGQVKDMFGGIKTAVVAVGKETAKLVTNPWILLGTVLATVAVAAYQADERMKELAISTAKGNQVAGSAKNLSALSEDLNSLANINIGSADAAVGSLAESGLLVGKNFKLAAEAAARWATITGQSADTVTAKFIAIARDPMAAILDGTLRVTAAQYEELAALDRLGDKQGEVNKAVQLYYDQINNNSQSVQEELTATEKVWQRIKDNITSAWHELGKFKETAKGAQTTGFGAPLGMSAGAGSAASTVFAMQAGAIASSTPDPIGGGRGKINPDAVTESKENVTLTLDQIAANKENQRAIDELGTKTQKYKTQLKLLNVQLGRSDDLFLQQRNITREAGGTFSGAGYDKLVNGLKLKVFGQNQGPEPTKAIKAWEKAAIEAIKNVQQEEDYLYADRVSNADDYFRNSRADVELEKDIQLDSIEQQIQALKGREHSEDAIAALKERRVDVEQQAARRIGALNREEIITTRQRIAAQQDYTQALADTNTQLERQGQQTATGVGMGSAQAGLKNSKDNAVYAAQLRDRETDKELQRNSIDQDEASKRKEASAAALSQQLDILQNNYDSLKDAESNYLNGSKKAWEDWSRGVQNNAAFTGKLVTDTFDGIASNLADLIATGKSGFKDLFVSLEKMIIEFGVKQAALAAANGFSNGGGFAGALTGIMSLFGGGSTPAASSAGDAANLDVGTFTSLVSLFAAKGAAVGGGGLAGYRNSIVSQPTYFPFSRGGVPNVGLMGEKSGASEAIMPLTRTSGGELAVKATGARQQRPVNFNQTVVVAGTVNRNTQDQIATKTYGAATRATRRNG